MTTALKNFVHGSRPSHIHVVEEKDGTVVRIECNSPYCIDMSADPRELEPVIEGREPWRK